MGYPAAVPYCPNCQLELAADAARCTRCNADLGGAGWRPTDTPAAPVARYSRAQRIFLDIVKLALAAASLFLLWLAWEVADRPRGDFPWRFAAVVLAVIVVLTTAWARARWMFLVLLGSFAFFFSSCVSNFHWG